MKPSWCAITTCWSLNYTGLCSDQVWPLGAATVRNVLSGDCHCLTWGRRFWRQWDALATSSHTLQTEYIKKLVLVQF